MKLYLKTILSLAFLLTTFSSIFAQEVGVGTDFVSRYVWRGADFGNSPSIQPALNFSAGGFEIGAWGAFQTGRGDTVSAADELDLYLGYSLDIGKSSLSFVVTDYYFPNAGIRMGNFNNYDAEDGKGAHLIEIGASLSGPETLPLYISAFVNVYNDADNSSYFEIGYSTALKDVSLDFFVGASPGGDNLYYGTSSFNVINIGITGSKEIKITDDFSLPIFAQYIINPNQEISHLVLGISL